MKTIYKVLFIFSLLTIIVSLALISIYGLRLGIDFKGGSALKAEFTQAPNLEKARSALRQAGFDNFTVSHLGQKGIIIKTEAIDEARHQALLEVLRKNVGQFEEKSFESIGPVIGRELKTRSIQAIILALAAVTIYLTIMFRKLSRIINPWSLGLATIVASAHDLLFPMAVFAYLGKIKGIEIDAAMIAVALTILGYSVNDTVVVFDRIRENVLTSTERNFKEAVHLSVKQTLFRSLSTSIATLLSLTAIFWYGGETLKNFSLALIVGVASGAYSSISLAAPLLMVLPQKKKGLT